MKILVPVASPAENAKISEHFGRSPYFAVVTIEDDSYTVRFVPNMREQGIRASDMAIKEGIDVVVVTNIGFGALNMLKSAGIRICKATKNSLKDLIEDITRGVLQDFEDEGCPGKGHHKNHEVKG